MRTEIDGIPLESLSFGDPKNWEKPEVGVVYNFVGADQDERSMNGQFILVTDFSEVTTVLKGTMWEVQFVWGEKVLTRQYSPMHWQRAVERVSKNES